MATGYSRKNTCHHLYRLRCVLECVGTAGSGAKVSTAQLAKLFMVSTMPPWRAALYRGSHRAYQRFLASHGRLLNDAPAPPFSSCLEEYRQFLREVRGFAPTTSAQHLSTVTDFLSHTLGTTPSLAALTHMHLELRVLHTWIGALEPKSQSSGSSCSVVALTRWESNE